MASPATIQAWLDEAEAALHALSTGSKAEELRFAAGAVQRSVRYTAADVNQLRAYIADLRRQLGQATRRRAIGVMY